MQAGSKLPNSYIEFWHRIRTQLPKQRDARGKLGKVLAIILGKRSHKCRYSQYTFKIYSIPLTVVVGNSVLQGDDLLQGGN